MGRLEITPGSQKEKLKVRFGLGVPCVGARVDDRCGVGAGSKATYQLTSITHPHIKLSSQFYSRLKSLESGGEAIQQPKLRRRASLDTLPRTSARGEDWE